jgi:hypothetical protein
VSFASCFPTPSPSPPIRKSHLDPFHCLYLKQAHVDAHFWGHFGVVGGKDFEHPPMRCAAARAAEVGAKGRLGHVSTDIGLGVAADADLGRVVIAPESGVFGTECAVAVVQIVGLARHCDAHRATVASPIVRGDGLGSVRHAVLSIRTPAQRQAALLISAPHDHGLGRY